MTQIIPLILVFILLGKQLVTGIMQGAVTGRPSPPFLTTKGTP